MWWGTNKKATKGRVFAPLVAERHFGLAHGMGRSGNLVGPQPKAAGSSLLIKLTNLFATQMIRAAGHTDLGEEVVVIPMATGMTIFLCLTTLKRERPDARCVIWCRCDQNSAPKAVALAGLHLVVVEMALQGEELCTDMEAIRKAVESSGGPRNVCCILSTTSCFAPRACDDIEAIARLCKEADIPHLINHAYGVQCARSTKLIARAVRVGRVDAFVSSTDKNFMVPVGGAIIGGRLSSLAGVEYAGRAASTPVVDVLITALTMGMDGWKALLQRREALFDQVRDRLAAGPVDGLRLLRTPGNRISMALAFTVLEDDHKGFGSMLFTRGITGHRVCTQSSDQSTTAAGGATFINWGQHCNEYAPCKAYVTVAVAMGVEMEDVDKFIVTANKVMKELTNKTRDKKKE